MNRVVAFGEILLRLKSIGHERLFQTQNMEATFGGSEANVAAVLSELGQETSFVTEVPDNALGDAAITDLRKFGICTQDVVKKNGRLGIYFLEAGAGQRASKVIYDRENSCIANADVLDFDWDKIFADSAWFHVSGITPAISEKAKNVTLQGMKAAKEKGLMVSMDINYRAKLWQYGADPKSVLQEMVSTSNILIANEEHVRKFLDINVPGFDVSKEGLPDEYFVSMCELLKKKFPDLKCIALTKRRTYSSDTNDFSAVLYDADKRVFYVSKKYHIENIVDRVGGGDAFTGGLIYGLLNCGNSKSALEFATATGCLKHTIPGDIAILNKADVEALIKSDGARIQR